MELRGSKRVRWGEVISGSGIAVPRYIRCSCSCPSSTLMLVCLNTPCDVSRRLSLVSLISLLCSPWPHGLPFCQHWSLSSSLISFASSLMLSHQQGQGWALLVTGHVLCPNVSSAQVITYCRTGLCEATAFVSSSEFVLCHHINTVAPDLTQNEGELWSSDNAAAGIKNAWEEEETVTSFALWPRCGITGRAQHVLQIWDDVWSRKCSLKV